MKELEWPSRMKSPLDTRDMGKYCDFHLDYGHTTKSTKSCKALQWKIKVPIIRELLYTCVCHDKRRGMIVIREKPQKLKTVANLQ